MYMKNSARGIRKWYSRKICREIPREREEHYYWRVALDNVIRVYVYLCICTVIRNARAPYVYLRAAKPSRRGCLALAAKGAREKLYGIIGTALRSLAHAKYALQRVTYLLCVSKRVARFLQAGECRWVMRQTLSAVSESRECTRDKLFLAFLRFMACSVPAAGHGSATGNGWCR